MSCAAGEAVLATLESLRAAQDAGEFTLGRAERSWLKRLSEQAEQLPEDEVRFIGDILGTVDKDKVRLEQYELML